MAASMDEAEDDLSMMDTAIVVYTENAQKMRLFLEEDRYWDSCRRLQKLEGNVIAIPVETSISLAINRVSTNEDAKMLQYGGKILKSGHYRDLPCHLVSVSLPLSKKQLAVSPHQRLVDVLRGRFEELDIPFPGELREEIPAVWEKHEDLVLLPQLSFRSSVWQRCLNLWPLVARALGGQRLARKGRIKQDEFRSPRVELLLGNDGWVEHRDNGIRYTYDVTHCMFSVGNITEKMRVAHFDCRGETVVDLYAGIGYFTLPYLVYAKAAVVHACEWNPDAVMALKKNLVLNGVQDRCIVHQGDNKKVCPRGVADRVNLGLIPASEEGWPVACAALKPQSGGVLHIHGNVTSRTTMRTKETMPRRTQSHELVAQECGKSSSGERTASDVSLSPAGLRTANPSHPTGDSKNDLKPHEGAVDEGTQQEAEQSFGSTTSVDTDLQPKDYWRSWAQSTARKIQELLAEIQGGRWTTEVTHVEHVKSYAPHVDHIVADIRCLPLEPNPAAV
ncbi:tRNA wybutosine-synthesizing protein 2 homolog [Patiria miniata]|uniref:tRNA(Phe) (4-demethylwyosine(37)-C(7)) aminocarboxypropyltransferase n=1 Tax=Patiria miniata TaxID=46514 RepID=A0A913ZLM8_PATMI|nr:tRNA wybutosine-synthesizing protein 2 homolog [Patiria miniata]